MLGYGIILVVCEPLQKIADKSVELDTFRSGHHNGANCQYADFLFSLLATSFRKWEKLEKNIDHSGKLLHPATSGEL